MSRLAESITVAKANELEVNESAGIRESYRVEGLRQLSKPADTIGWYRIERSEHWIAGAGDLHKKLWSVAPTALFCIATITQG